MIGAKSAYHFLKRLHGIVKDNNIREAMIFNADETCVSKLLNREKVVIKRGAPKPIELTSNRMIDHVTLMLTSCLNGTYCKSSLISETLIKPSLDIHKDNFDFYSAPSGYMTKEIFHNIVSSTIFPVLEQKRQRSGNPEEKALLLVDNHASRFDEDMLQDCADHNLLVVPLPTHSSHWSQPNDQHINLVCKEAFSKLFRSKIGGNHRYTDEDLVSCILYGVQSAMKTETIIQSWAKSHLFEDMDDKRKVLSGVPTVLEGFKRKAPLRKGIAHKVHRGALNSKKNIELIRAHNAKMKLEKDKKAKADKQKLLAKLQRETEEILRSQIVLNQ